MDISKISTGKNAPFEVNAFIEIPQGGAPIKYELDKDSGAIFVDRFLHTAMYYPANYGFIPNTLADDGDPADIMVLTNIPVVPGVVIPCRPIGVLKMRDEAGIDDKILAVPTAKIAPFYADIKTYTDLPEILVQQIAHFFARYKDLEKGKMVEVVGWEGPDVAYDIIRAGIAAGAK
jgi:inorganic pyrophosphatase